jgi:ribosomal protein L10
LLYGMSIKKYKTLKSISTLFNLNKVLKNSSFFCFVQIKHLNHNEWLILKQMTYSLNLKILVCKNTFLRSRNILLNLPKKLLNSLNHGNLFILYSYNYANVFALNKIFNAELSLKKINIFPLIFYYLDRFFYLQDFLEISRISRIDAFSKLISILEHHNYSALNKLVYSNKYLLFNLPTKKI